MDNPNNNIILYLEEVMDSKDYVLKAFKLKNVLALCCQLG